MTIKSLYICEYCGSLTFDMKWYYNKVICDWHGEINNDRMRADHIMTMLKLEYRKFLEVDYYIKNQIDEIHICNFINNAIHPNQDNFFIYLNKLRPYIRNGEIE